MSENNKQVLVDANAAVSKGDYEGFLKFCTEDTKWNFVGEQELEGKIAVLKYMNEVYIKPPKNDVKHLVAENSFLIATGEIAILQKDGKSVRSAYCDVWKLRDGKLAELYAYVIEIR